MWSNTTKCMCHWPFSPTGIWRNKLGNGKLSPGFVEAIKVFFFQVINE